MPMFTKLKQLVCLERAKNLKYDVKQVGKNLIIIVC